MVQPPGYRSPRRAAARRKRLIAAPNRQPGGPTSWRRKPSGSPNTPPLCGMRIYPPKSCGRPKNCIADTVAAIICGSALPWSQIVIRYAERTGPGGKSRILGNRGAPVQANAAALANGALAHAFELDALTRPGAGAHPGATVLPPALAVAQERGSDGRALIAAFVAGNEVMIRIGRATGHTNEARGFHAPGTTGPFGAAVAAGHLLAARPRGDDQCARHRRVARRRIARIRPRRRRHGQALASRAGLGGGCARRQPGRRWFRGAAHRARRRVRVSQGVLHEMGRGRIDPRPRRGRLSSPPRC